MKFKENCNGGVDIYNETDNFLLHLSNEDIAKIGEIQQHKEAVDVVKNRIPTWVERQVEEDWEFADFNSHLYSGDEISGEQIYQKIMDNPLLIGKIMDEYQDILNSPLTTQGLQTWVYADEAIGTHVSIKDIMGELLCDKHPKELCVGQWRVAVVEQGETYGNYGGAVHDDKKPVVEFYDMSQDKAKFPEGQFTGGRYYLETLMKTDLWSKSIEEMANENVGLCLHGDVPSWTVKAGDLSVIATWLKKVQNVLAEKNQEKVVYHGEVDVPHDYVGLAKYNDFDTIIGASEELLRDRLSAVPEFSPVSVEHFGNYIGGYGFSFSFATTLDEITTQALLKHVLLDLNHEVERDNVENTLEDTLAEAKEKCDKQNNANDIVKSDVGLDK